MVGPPVVAPPTPQQQQQQNVAATQLQLYTYRLKHASATALAPLLTSLFANTTGTGVGTNVANPAAGAFNNNALPGAGTTGAGVGGRNGGGGRAGGGGGGAGNFAGGNAVGVGVGTAGVNALAGIQGLQNILAAVAASVVRPSRSRAAIFSWFVLRRQIGR